MVILPISVVASNSIPRMRPLPTLLLLSVSLGLVIAGPSAAQAQPAKQEAAPADRKAAIELFGRSRAAYQAGRFAEAAELLRQAYALDPAPTLLYNLARALESDGDLDGAADAYRRYIEADPDAKDRPAIEKRVSNLEAQIAEREELRRKLEAQASAPPAPAPEVVTAPPPAEGPSVVPWVVAGAGAASLIAGATLGGLAQSKHADADDPATPMADAVRLDDEARGLARGANIAFGVGGALAAGGLIWGLVDVLSGGEDDAASDFALGPALAPGGVALTGRF